MLLLELAGELSARGERVLLLRPNACERVALPPAVPGTALLVDGAGRLGSLDGLLLPGRSRRRSLLVVTAHRPTFLPPLV